MEDSRDRTYTLRFGDVLCFPITPCPPSLSAAGFEPAHANIPGPKPGSLDHSDKPT